jgi:ubiquinone/menaquinone biosynthesis C-methylase UbiE
MSKASPTRGSGFLETFLSKKRSQIANTLIQDCHRNGSILDIGCGSYPFFLSMTEFSHKFAIDRINDADYQSNFSKELVFINQDLEAIHNLPFDDNYFNVITMLAFIEHIDHDSCISVFHEAYRTLKPGGVVIVTTPLPWTKGILEALSMINLVSRSEIDEHKELYNAKKLTTLLKQTSFSEDKIHYGYFECFMNMWGIAEK